MYHPLNLTHKSLALRVALRINYRSNSNDAKIVIIGSKLTKNWYVTFYLTLSLHVENQSNIADGVDRGLLTNC